jgi:hypothetical protein
MAGILFQQPVGKAGLLVGINNNSGIAGVGPESQPLHGNQTGSLSLQHPGKPASESFLFWAMILASGSPASTFAAASGVIIDKFSSGFLCKRAAWKLAFHAPEVIHRLVMIRLPARLVR